MKYAHYDEKEKTLLGYYDDEIHDAIPTPNIEISDEDWAKALTIGANSVKDGKMIYVSPKIDEKAKHLAEIEAEISECENHIRHALIIGNNAVLESLRAELKELITQREQLRK